MKLLCLTHSLSDVDGAGRYGTEVLRRVAKRFDAVEVLIARKHRGVSERLPEPVRVRVALPPDYFLYLKWPRFFAELVAAYRKVLRAARDADLIHALSDYPHAMLAVLAAKKLRKPVLVSGHGTYSVAPFRVKLHARMITWTYGNAAAVLMGSAFALSRLQQCHAFPNARVVRYGVDVAQFAGAETLPRPARAPARYVLTIGEVKERKGHHVSIPAFCEAAAKHRDVHLVVIGNAVEGDPYFAARRREAEQAGVAERVHFVGLVPEREKIAWLAHADAFLLTSVTSREGGFEAFGLVYLEANACGVPTVGIRDSGAQDAILHGETGLLADGPESASLAEAIGGTAANLDRLLGDAALRRRLGERGRAWAAENDWDGSVRDIEALYDSLLGAARPRRIAS